MGISEIRTCPHCGASVSGNTDRCPNCDRKLEVDLSPTPTPSATPVPMKAPMLPPDLLPEVLATNPDYKAAHPAPEAQGDFKTFVDPAVEELINPALAGEPEPEDDLQAEPEAESEPISPPKLPAEADPAQTFVPTDYKTVIEPSGAPTMPPIAPTVAPNDFRTVIEETHEPTPLDNLVVSPRPNVVDDEIDRTYIVPDEPNKTQPAILSAFGSTSPISPSTRVPDPEPLPPLALETPAKSALPVPTHTPVTGTQSIVIPSAPFTPPPIVQPPPQVQPQFQTQYQAPPMPYPQYQQPSPMMAQPQAMPYQQRQQTMPSDYWLQQRIYAYQTANYKLEARNAYEALLSQGKSLPFLWWIVALGTVFGALWYFMILITSGLKRDKVYIGLEPEGYVFEEGAGAAHVRLKRARSGRRWGFLGIALMILSALFFFLLVVAGSVIYNRYETAIQQAYPEVSWIQGDDTGEDLPASEVQDAKVIVLVMIILTSTAALGVVGGFMLAVISYIQAAAYRVTVPALPGYD